MMRINKELSDQLAQRMYVDPGDEDYGQCFFNARRALFRLTRLRIVDEAQYTEGYAVYLNYGTESHCVAGHGWVTYQGQAIDTDYASFSRDEAVYFPGLQLSAEEVYQRLKTSLPPGNQSAFGLMPMSEEMIKAYVAACEYMISTWPGEVTPYDLDHLDQWQHTLAIISKGGQK